MVFKYATGAHIPPEVLDNVVLSFTDLSAHPTRGVDMNKRELGLCSLVCRLWARRCRPHLFHSLSVLSLDDFNYFLHLLDSAKVVAEVPSLAECVSYMDVRHSGPWTVPWFHRIRQELADCDVHIYQENMSLEVEEAYLPHQEGTRGYAPRSLSTSLPRTIPPTVFPHGILLLTELHFHTASDLIRLIDDQPVLSSVNWKRLTFDKPEEGEMQLPRPRVRRRRLWPHLGNFTIAQWSDVDLEIHLVFLVVAEKLNTSLTAISDWWSVMARTTNCLILPTSRQLEFNINDDVVRVSFETAGPEPHFTHDIEYHIAHSPDPFPSVYLFRICFHYPEKAADLERVDWAAFEEAVLSMDPIPEVELHVARQERADLFRWLLDAICEKKILSRLYDRGKIEAGFPANNAWWGSDEYQYLALEEVMAFPSEHVVNGQTLKLSESQKFELWLHEDDDDDRREFFDRIASGSFS